MMERISIQEIAAILTQKSGLRKKDAERFATTIFEVVKDGLEAERLVKIKGLGTFKVIDIEARESVNVNTGERVLIEGHGKVTFTPDATMKELVNKPFSQFETVVLNDGVDFDDMDSSDVAEADTMEPEPEPVAQEAEPEPVVQEAEPEPVAQEPEPEAATISNQTPSPLEGLGEAERLPILDFFENEPPEQPQEEAPANDDSAAEETAHGTTEGITEEKLQDQTFMIEKNSGKRTHVVWLLAALLACICSFALGYYLGLNNGKTVVELPLIEEIAENPDTLMHEIVTPDSTTVKDSGVDEPAHEVEPAEPVAEVESPVVETPKPTPKPDESPKARPESAPAAPDMYEQMDARVRTGAYRIVGADYDVKVKAGETTARVAKRTLGPDMECYIEVFNGLNGASELKEGQTLKIPKLELKKKKKQNK